VNPFPRYKHPIEPEMLLLIVYLFWEARRIQFGWPIAKISPEPGATGRAGFPSTTKDTK
jgi:hypothetical protein